MIYIDSRKKKEKTLIKNYPNATFVDVSSKATTSLVKLSPFYPHGDIPVPFSENVKAFSVESIWQGLKVFENTDIDISLFSVKTMKNLKRTVRKFGKPLGHRKGVLGVELLTYLDARIKIYLPSYKWILENKVQNIVEQLKIESENEDIVLLDYETNCDILNTKKPLSHAFLVKAYVENKFPTEEELYRELEIRKSMPKEDNNTHTGISSKSKKKPSKGTISNQSSLF